MSKCPGAQIPLRQNGRPDDHVQICPRSSV